MILETYYRSRTFRKMHLENIPSSRFGERPPWSPWSPWPSGGTLEGTWRKGYKVKKILLVPLRPSNTKMEHLNQKTQILIISVGFQLFLTKNQVQLRVLVQFDVVCTRKWSKTTQRPQIPLIRYLWVEYWTIRSEIVKLLTPSMKWWTSALEWS